MRTASWLGGFMIALLAGGTQAWVQSARADDRGLGNDHAVVRADDKQDDKVDEEKIGKNLAKLSKKDRKLALEQKYCVIEDENRLGEMGVPIKLTIKGQPVFLCCKGCKKDALAHPDQTLAKVKELKEKNKKESK
jgi:hypothetical protein